MISLVFVKTNSLWGKAIRAFTRSEYNHVGLVDGHHIIDSSIGHGVRRTPLNEIQGEITIRYVLAPQNVINRVAGQIGKPYDLLGALAIPFRKNWHDRRKWFCSELVAWAFEEEGITLVNKHLSRITPQDLLESPLVKADRGMH